MHTKEFSLSQKSAATLPESVGSWVISSPAYDRVNDRITLPALKSQVGKDVLCLWQHDANQPVGRWANVRMSGEKLVADLILAKTAMGEMIKALLDVQTPLGASIGFKGAGKRNEKGGIDFASAEIFETSVVSVPCNGEALRIAKNFGFTLQSSESEARLVASDRQASSLDKAKSAILTANKTLRS